MTKSEFYYLLMVCGAFAVFGLVLAYGGLTYRRWLKVQATTAPQVAERPAPREIERRAA